MDVEVMVISGSVAEGDSIVSVGHTEIHKMWCYLGTKVVGEFQDQRETPMRELGSYLLGSIYDPNHIRHIRTRSIYLNEVHPSFPVEAHRINQIFFQVNANPHGEIWITIKGRNPLRHLFMSRVGKTQTVYGGTRIRKRQEGVTRISWSRVVGGGTYQKGTSPLSI
jgi:hypothetical protein